MTEDLGQSPKATGQAAQTPEQAPEAMGQQTIINIVNEQKKPKKARNAGVAVIRTIVWIIVVIVVLLLALYVSAWIAGFRNADGFPILFDTGGYSGMLDWIRNSIQA